MGFGPWHENMVAQHYLKSSEVEVGLDASSRSEKFPWEIKREAIARFHGQTQPTSDGYKDGVWYTQWLYSQFHLFLHKALSLWEDESTNNRNSSVWSLAVIRYDCWVTWHI